MRRTLQLKAEELPFWQNAYLVALPGNSSENAALVADNAIRDLRTRIANVPRENHRQDGRRDPQP